MSQNTEVPKFIRKGTKLGRGDSTILDWGFKGKAVTTRNSNAYERMESTIDDALNKGQPYLK